MSWRRSSREGREPHVQRHQKLIASATRSPLDCSDGHLRQVGDLKHESRKTSANGFWFAYLRLVMWGVRGQRIVVLTDAWHWDV